MCVRAKEPVEMTPEIVSHISPFHFLSIIVQTPKTKSQVQVRNLCNGQKGSVNGRKLVSLALPEDVTGVNATAAGAAQVVE